MVQVILENDRILFEIMGWDKLWAFKSRLAIPFDFIRGARVDPDLARQRWKGWRIPGTQIPGVITAGTFYKKGQRSFWDVHDPAKAIVVDLENHKYTQIVIEVEDPMEEVRRIQSVVPKSPG
jgi:hypothetical protein